MTGLTAKAETFLESHPTQYAQDQQRPTGDETQGEITSGHSSSKVHFILRRQRRQFFVRVRIESFVVVRQLVDGCLRRRDSGSHYQTNYDGQDGDQRYSKDTQPFL